ncbi:MAG: aminoacyl-tRNA synthetase [Polaromonas sp.]
MRMNDQDYFRSCIARERQLAQLLGHQHIEECYESAGTLWDNAQALPQWTRDWRACGPLMTEYGIALVYGKEAGQEDSSFARIGVTTVHFADHPTRDRAVMYGIVKEVIFLLEHGKVAGPAWMGARKNLPGT